MEVYVSEQLAPEIIRIAAQFGVAAQVVGRVEASPNKKVTISSEHGAFTYEG